ncbi:MAG: SIS domain-containing protein [Calditrichia bacterium]|nr:SIS domain-containing protein [Calditrichia bacterium]
MKTEWKKLIETAINDSMEVKTRLMQENETALDRAIQQLLSTIRNGGKIMLCGNGGSAADAQHIAAELVIRLKSSSNRPAIAAQALTVDTSILTAGANDFGFDFVFSRQIEALGKHGDTLIALSTSGNSSNVIEAVNMAHEMGLYVIGLLGGNGGNLRKIVDLPIIVPSDNTARIQENHILISHIVCEILEGELFSKV